MGSRASIPIENDVTNEFQDDNLEERFDNEDTSVVALWQQFKVGDGKAFYNEFPTVELLIEAQTTFLQQNFPIEKQKGVPIAHPGSKYREEVLKQANCAAIDEYVLQITPELYHEDLRDAVNQIVKTASCDLEKVRAIFHWITSQHLQTMEIKSKQHPNTANYFLCDIKDGTRGYHRLLEEMCRLINVRCHTVRGWMKEARYGPGDAFPKLTGEWSAILLDDTWWLADCRWSAVHFNASAVNKDQFKDVFFLSDPWEFIYSHYPINPEWQLLARIVSREEFRQLPCLQPKFFEMGFKNVTMAEAISHTDNGCLTISLQMPKHGSLRFSHRLTRSSSETRFGQYELERYVALSTDHINRMIDLVFKLPTRGRYIYELFCEDTDNTAGVFHLIAKYCVTCPKILSIPRPYPSNSLTEWGPGTALMAYGTHPVSHTNGIISTKINELVIKFCAKKRVEFRHKLLGIHPSIIDYMNYILLETHGDTVVFRIRIPKSGTYALKIYAKELAGDNSSFHCVCCYLINSEITKDNREPFPREWCEKNIGATDEFEELGLERISPDKPYLETQLGELDLKFKLPANRDICAKLVHYPTKQEMNGYMKVQIKSDKLTIHIEFPDVGLYHCMLMVKTSQGSEFQPVYHQLIEALLPKIGSLTFPEPSNDWNPRFEIVKPVYGILVANKGVQVQVKIPGAKSVTLSTTPPIVLTRNRLGVWTGAMTTNPQEGEIQLTAKMNSEKDVSMLTFKVVSSEAIDKITSNQKSIYESRRTKMDPVPNGKNSKTVNRKTTGTIRTDRSVQNKKMHP